MNNNFSCPLCGRNHKDHWDRFMRYVNVWHYCSRCAGNCQITTVIASTNDEHERMTHTFEVHGCSECLTSGLIAIPFTEVW